MLPLDVWGEILVRLPSECLIRMRAVSKGWRAVIDDPCFVRRHTNNLSSSNNKNNIIITRTRPPFYEPIGFYSLDLETLINFSKEPFLKIPGECLYFSINPLSAKKLPTTPLDFFADRPAGLALSRVAACNGLILTEKPLRIWNPLTNERLELPRFCHTERAAFGLGYDRTTDDYKVVAINRRIRHGRQTHRTHVYSLKSDSWRRTINCPCAGDSPRPLGPAVFVCGALNWLTYSGTCYEKKIVALDIGAEKYRLLQMPLRFGFATYPNVLLAVLDGCLVLTNKFGKNNSYFDVWVLKDYEDHNSWIKLLSIKKHDFCLNDHLSPVAFLKEDKTQVFLQEDGCFRFFVFNVETNKLKRVEIHGLTTKNYDHLYAQQMCPPTILRLHDNCGGGRKPSSSSSSTSKTKKASPGFQRKKNNT